MKKVIIPLVVTIVGGIIVYVVQDAFLSNKKNEPEKIRIDNSSQVIVGDNSHIENNIEEDLYSKSVEEQLGILILRKKATLVNDFSDFIKVNNLTNWIDNGQCKTFELMPVSSDNPSAIPRLILIFHKDSLLAILHLKPIDINAEPESISHGYMLSYVKDPATDEREAIEYYKELLETAG